MLNCSLKRKNFVCLANCLVLSLQNFVENEFSFLEKKNYRI